MFPLCAKCSQDNVTKDWCFPIQCQHSPQERSFVSTSSHLELEKALSKGYQISHVYECYIWEKWSTTLFADYIRKNLKVKIEASGIPSGMDFAAQERYIQQVWERYGIRIERAKWVLNEGLRTIAKLRLNSSWGKFAQRDNLDQVELCRNRFDLDAIFNNPAFKVKDCVPITDDVVLVNYRRKEEYAVENQFSNVVIALYTTSAARLRLYEFMEQCESNGGRVLYTDTDSIIMQSCNDQIPVEIGHFLGDMELEKPSYEIMEFVSGGKIFHNFH